MTDSGVSMSVPQSGQGNTYVMARFLSSTSHLIIIGLDVEPQPTVRAPRVVGHELVDNNASACRFCDALREPEMKRTHRVGIGEGGCRERAGA